MNKKKNKLWKNAIVLHHHGSDKMINLITVKVDNFLKLKLLNRSKRIIL